MSGGAGIGLRADFADDDLTVRRMPLREWLTQSQYGFDNIRRTEAGGRIGVRSLRLLSIRHQVLSRGFYNAGDAVYAEIHADLRHQVQCLRSDFDCLDRALCRLKGSRNLC